MRVLLLDLDGTLANTASVHKEAWEISLKRLGIEAKVNLDLLMGRRTIDIAKTLAGERYQELFELKNAIYDELVSTKASPLPCAKELVTRAKSKGYSTAVVTSSLRRSALRSLEAVGISPDLLIAGDEVPIGKPDPYPVYLALDKLKGKPEQSAGVGDTIYDFQAFKRAGIRNIFIIKGLDSSVSSLIEESVTLVDTPCQVIQALNL
ncbi:MAG: HAD-IA family hydrolase [Metallosphaera sp.]|uniref:HAD family hydrolase n=1 Tax=Metallosphaera cuprina (strain Ar-4) TaxID=1006006 RepID=F4FYZ2_METCR|nr:HAD-IA family hydrolase [Metallosphaera cuprina]AEB95562.1 HAD family hydrolase [Metallosphaera cuprina Ar-4]